MRITGDGIWGSPKDPDLALSVLRRAVELGVNFIDTADSYGPHVSEELIARALAPYPQDLVIATKGGWKRPGPGQWTHDASPKHLREAAEGSLRRLRLERIDVYQLHIPDPAVPFEASVETLAQLQAEGKIRFIGLSNVTKEHIERARKIVPAEAGWSGLAVKAVTDHATNPWNLIDRTSRGKSGSRFAAVDRRRIPGTHERL
jgi:pyridoxine 4-dehydrogenase